MGPSPIEPRRFTFVTCSCPSNRTKPCCLCALPFAAGTEASLNPICPAALAPRYPVLVPDTP
eukprot:2437654-Rhodomonas_salina.1